MNIQRSNETDTHTHTRCLDLFPLSFSSDFASFLVNETFPIAMNGLCISVHFPLLRGVCVLVRLNFVYINVLERTETMAAHDDLNFSRVQANVQHRVFVTELLCYRSIFDFLLRCFFSLFFHIHLRAQRTIQVTFSPYSLPIDLWIAPNQNEFELNHFRFVFFMFFN